MEYLETDLKEQEWYQNLVDDCQTIIIERGLRARMEVIEGYHELGKRIQTDVNFKKYAKGRGETVNNLAKDIGISGTTLYCAMQFYEKYPDVSKALGTFEEGKNISWFKIVNKYLTEPKKNKEKKYLNSEAEQQFSDYIKKSKPHLQVTKKGLPDFMLINKGEIVGFVEVKRSEMNDGLREEQELFRKFCKKYKIPYQVWSPIMARERWKEANKFFKNTWAYGEEIWDKI